jgi:hypothetical protein
MGWEIGGIRAVVFRALVDCRVSSVEWNGAELSGVKQVNQSHSSICN